MLVLSLSSSRQSMGVYVMLWATMCCLLTVWSLCTVGQREGSCNRVSQSVRYVGPLVSTPQTPKIPTPLQTSHNSSEIKEWDWGQGGGEGGRGVRALCTIERQQILHVPFLLRWFLPLPPEFVNFSTVLIFNNEHTTWNEVPIIIVYATKAPVPPLKNMIALVTEGEIGARQIM